MCIERVSLCEICGFTRHITWLKCNSHMQELIAAVSTLKELPQPSGCAFVGPAEVVSKLNKRACPTDNEGCGGLRKKEEQERERKDSGVAGVEDDESEAVTVGSGEGPDNIWEDCAVTDESGAEEPVPPVRRWFQLWADRWKPLYPNIKYAKGYVAAGDSEMRPNYRNMGLSYAVHNGVGVRPHQDWGFDIVRPAPTRFRPHPDTSVIEDVEIRDSIEPDETYLLIKGYDTIPEVRAQWAEKKRRNPGQERPVVTVADAVEKIFGRPQNVRE